MEKFPLRFIMQRLSAMDRRVIIGTEVEGGQKLEKFSCKSRDTFVTMETFVPVGGVLIFVIMKELMAKAQM